VPPSKFRGVIWFENLNGAFCAFCATFFSQLIKVNYCQLSEVNYCQLYLTNEIDGRWYVRGGDDG
jgi:hypothetical protein